MSLLNLQLIAFVLLVSQLTACTTSTPERRGAAITIPASQKIRAIEADADSLGRQLYDVPHVTNPAFLEELRNNEPRFTGLSDSDIMGYMHAMGPNYTWYLSDDNVSGVYGVLPNRAARLSSVVVPESTQTERFAMSSMLVMPLSAYTIMPWPS